MNYKNTFKRLFDLVISIIMLTVLSPILIIATILLFFANNGKPFFFQKRPGKNEKIFNIIKFKTMTDKKDANGKLLPDSQRLTTIGKFVRKASIDEIPQLFNVLKGDMSIIGPRPLLPEYLPYYTTIEKIRHQVRPGITGLAQVNGRNYLEWNPRLKLDVEYVENVSLKLDFNILMKTVYKVLASKDIATDATKSQPYLNELRKNDFKN
ncbi:Undecaprenyl phosphate N-2CN'-diacetylbacillosamine 1-phosphate transferase [Mariniflexile rhizosphaerae]|uniref:sugar transferase n=1 Tax=unclassified Mariniflexile TaxID=2643887 RepID=UPI000CBAB35B|nr:sugar transferase [Mariniflexile sp. TRM1-10]AXP82447.1 Undecaprenyl phosphate N-2CN'-diacetylbacillosamine 1-phosphate transferase [Mariniflexile sp. TRM1-10]PLB18387.1 MAG: Undecaprenyl-phosphate galactose phosphotransferase [Flavobacteriaceae bacterium FS1-H7996/R]